MTTCFEMVLFNMVAVGALHMVQKWMGHAQLSTTAIYAAVVGINRGGKTGHVAASASGIPRPAGGSGRDPIRFAHVHRWLPRRPCQAVSGSG